MSRHSYCRAFWYKLKKMNPKIVVVSPTFETKDFRRKEVDLATVPFEYGCGRRSKSWRKSLHSLGTRIRKDLVVEKIAISLEKVPLPMDLPAWRESQVDFSESRQSFESTRVHTSLVCASGSYTMASTHSSWRLHIKSRSDSSSSTSVSATCADQ